jgi:hypothetical protein
MDDILTRYIFIKNSIPNENIRTFMESQTNYIVLGDDFMNEFIRSFAIDYYVIGRMLKKYNSNGKKN